MNSNSIYLKANLFLDGVFFPSFEKRNLYSIDDDSISTVILSNKSRYWDIQDWCIFTLTIFLCKKEELLFSFLSILDTSHVAAHNKKYSLILNSFFNNFTIFLTSAYLSSDFQRYANFFKNHFTLDNDITLLNDTRNVFPFLENQYIVPNQVVSNASQIHQTMIEAYTSLPQTNSTPYFPTAITDQLFYLITLVRKDHQRLIKIFDLLKLCPPGIEPQFFPIIESFLSIIKSDKSFNMFFIDDTMSSQFSDLFSNPTLVSIAFKENSLSLLPFCDVPKHIALRPDLFI